jgi:hypothetical protein
MKSLAAFPGFWDSPLHSKSNLAIRLFNSRTVQVPLMYSILEKPSLMS